MYSIFNNTPQIAVVPIFVNAGTALLPAILAPIASALALLFKPRELFALARRRPLVIPSVLLAVIALGALAGNETLGGKRWANHQPNLPVGHRAERTHCLPL